MTVEQRFTALEETMQRIAVRHEQLVELHLTLGQIAELAHARLDKHDEVLDKHVEALDRIEADISILIKMNLPPQNGKAPEG